MAQVPTSTLPFSRLLVFSPSPPPVRVFTACYSQGHSLPCLFRSSTYPLRTRTRQRSSSDFEPKAVELVNQLGHAVAGIPAHLGNVESVLRRWKRELDQHDAKAFGGQGCKVDRYVARSRTKQLLTVIKINERRASPSPLFVNHPTIPWNHMNEREPLTADPLDSNARNRSNFVRKLVQRPNSLGSAPPALRDTPPKRIVQFWDDLGRLPTDVWECMESWKQLERSGFELQVFDERSAREFIRVHLGSRHVEAFNKCYHPSMKSDYFRYSYIFVEGGFYIDADDVYHGGAIDHLFCDGRLKLQPFCYDIATAQMVPASDFTTLGAYHMSWIFYFNTTPLIAARNHPIVERALLNATTSLESALEGELPEVQATTGPGNLTRSVFEVLPDYGHPEEALLVVHEWENISTSKWPLSYRSDTRNWRLSNQHAYQASRRPTEQQ